MKTKTKLIAKILAFAGVIMMLFALAIPCFASDETSVSDDSDAPYVTFKAAFSTTDFSFSQFLTLDHMQEGSGEHELYSYNVNAGVTIGEEYTYYTQSYDIQFSQDVGAVTMFAHDFYLWKTMDDDGANITNTLCTDFYITPRYEYDDAYEISIEATYCIVGMENEEKLYVDTYHYNYGSFSLSNAIDELAYDIDAPLYIHDIEIYVKFPATDNLHIDILTTPKSHAESVEIPNPNADDELELEQITYFTKWIAAAVSGFLDAEIMPGISFGGILTVIIAFSVVLMLLKMFR